jgi:hypothetical protein
MTTTRYSLIMAMLAVTTSAGAQARASEHGLVAQTIDGTTITVDYYRPVARGRAPLFGKVVKMDETWTPGANWATTVDVDRDVKINGQPLPKGKYSLWIVPAVDDWTVIFNKDVKLYHVVHPKKENDALRFTVKPAEGPHTEVLTWSFPAVARDGATLQMNWGTTVIPLRVDVEASKVLALGPAQRAIYAGDFDVKWEPVAQNPNARRFTVFDSSNTLWMRGPKRDPSLDATVEMVPAGNHKFLPAFYSAGKFIGVEADGSIVFDFDGGQVSGFRMLGLNEQPMARATIAKPTKP